MSESLRTLEPVMEDPNKIRHVVERALLLFDEIHHMCDESGTEEWGWKHDAQALVQSLAH